MISRVASNMSYSINDAQEYFVMGDFWPGNMMVVLEGEKLKNIYILDWELAKPGLPGVEIGQFCAEIHLLRRFDPFARAPASRILETFCEAYTYYGAPDVQVVRDALVHLGSHLIVLTPRIPWGDKASTRKVVQEGVQLLAGASSQDENWLRHSIVGGLMPR
ncbi:hypothetical protein BDZ94DRAFT_1243168 [Collybia nuda]|uniref:Aminoglycoside phosphotransferase domain-containing protein n=1 Tax=Collybia nuda TaxID=64659 RepID=A0A9P6CR74_9AGAR|nr:hypothetical protein BDZ94DRAFT_1243168 [Collybia nuda]